MDTGYVYVLRSGKDGNRYIGSTNNLTKRIHQHNNGLVASTRHRRPLELETVLEFPNIQEARMKERIFKKSRGSLEREIKIQHGT